MAISTRKLKTLQKAYGAALLEHAKFAKVGFTAQAEEAIQKARRIKAQIDAG